MTTVTSHMEYCVDLFLAGLKTQATKDNYMGNLEYFKKWLDVEKFQDIVDLDSKQLQRKVEEYILFRRKINHPNSVGGYYHPIQTFLEMNSKLHPEVNAWSETPGVDHAINDETVSIRQDS